MTAESQPESNPARASFLSYQQDTNFLRLLQRPAPATRILLVSLGVVFILGLLVTELVVEPRYGDPDDAVFPMILFGAKINTEIRAGAWWRLVTNTFLHGGWLHLIFNGYGLFVLGTIAERLFGTRRFVLIYAVAGIAGATASFAFNSMASVGASGAIFGVFGAAIVFGVKYRRVLPERVAKALSTGLLPWLLLSLAFGFLPMVDNAAHLGGLAVGVTVAAMMGSPLAKPSGTFVRNLQTALVGALVLVTLVSFALAIRFGAQSLASEETWEGAQEIELGEHPE